MRGLRASPWLRRRVATACSKSRKGCSCSEAREAPRLDVDQAGARVGVEVKDYEVAGGTCRFCSRGRSLERRRGKVREAVSLYQRQLLLTLDAERFAELGGRGLRQWLSDQTKELVIATVERWQRPEAG